MNLKFFNSGELIGTFLLTLIGNGSVAQLILGNQLNNGGGYGSFPVIAFGNALGLFIGLSASIPISGGHLNPAVTVTYALIKRCTWKQVNDIICFTSHDRFKYRIAWTLVYLILCLFTSIGSNLLSWRVFRCFSCSCSIVR